MAVFDGSERSKVVLDDTQTLICTLGAAENIQGHTVRLIYIIFHTLILFIIFLLINSSLL